MRNPVRMTSLVAAGVVLLCAPALSKNEPGALPLYAAFNKFCVDTGARPDAIAAAARAAGGVAHGAPDATSEPYPMRLTSWDIVVAGHRMVLNASAAYPSRKYDWAHASDDFSTCAIHSAVNEDASVAAIRSWAGVPADWSKSGPEQRDHLAQRYNFVTDGAKHVAATDKKASAGDRQWLLMLLQTPGGAALQLSHHFPATEQKQPRKPA